MTSDANDHTYVEAMNAALPRWRALVQKFADMWKTIEPSLRTWIADADTLTEQQWMDEAESTRAFYDYWKQWFVEHDTKPEETTQP